MNSIVESKYIRIHPLSDNDIKGAEKASAILACFDHFLEAALLDCAKEILSDYEINAFYEMEAKWTK